MHRRTSVREAPLRSQRGMSVIEVLVAAALLLVISLAILAMLTRSLQNNTRGWESTQAANYARTQLDQHLGEYLDAPALTIQSGSTESQTARYWSSGSVSIDNDDDEGWYDDELDAKGLVLVEQTRTVRQFNVSSLLGDADSFNDEGEFVYIMNFTTPLSGDIDPRFANVKQIEVTIEGRRQGGALGAGQRLKSETYKSY